MIAAIKKNILPVIISSAYLIVNQPAFAAKSSSEYRLLGLQYRQQERYNEAITAMETSVELEPENISGRVNLGWTLYLAGKQKAAQTLWQAIYQKPDFVPAYNALGIVYLVDGNLPAAVLVHTVAVFLKPNNEIAFYNLSLALNQLEIYPLAIKTANRAEEIEPNNPHPLIAAAISYWDSDDKIIAQQVYRQAINLDARYTQVPFLNHLKKAAFTQQQINTTKEILSSFKS
jgi:Flp pilus assembly protein TadD